MRGYLMFERDYKGRITYSQYLLSFRPIPQEWIDATWPVMKKIEADLMLYFGLNVISKKVETSYYHCLNPERNSPTVETTVNK